MENNKTLILWVLAGFISLAVFVAGYRYVFPAASVELNLSKNEAADKAGDFVRSQGFDLDGFDRAMIFGSDDGASVYLQKTQGVEKSNTLTREDVPVWFWSVRWFKEMEKEGFRVSVDPSRGEIVSFSHTIMEDVAGADLIQEEALALAEEKVSAMGIELENYQLKDSVTKKQKNRTDYNFVWEQKGFKADDATMRINLTLHGKELGSYSRFLKVPEKFFRDMRVETDFGAVLARLSNVVMFVLLLSALLLLVLKPAAISVDWKFGLAASGVLVALKALSLLNSIPLMWYYYPDTHSKAVYFLMSLVNGLTDALSGGLQIFAFGSLGELLARHVWDTKIPLINGFKNRVITLRTAAPVFIVGYSAGFIFLGYITVFYLCGEKLLHIWMPASAAYSNMLDTLMPFLYPMTVATSASLNEEFVFRLLAISYFMRIARPKWVALLVPALIWGFAHSTYYVFPAYVRGIELTIYGIFLGVLFLRYGLETVIIAHFVIDACLAGMPLFTSGNLYFMISGVAVIAAAFLPLGIIWYFVEKRKPLLS